MKNLFQNTQRVLLSVAASLLATACLTSCEKTSDNVQPAPTAAAPSQDFRLPETIRGINVNEDYYYQTNTFSRIHYAGFNTVRIVIRPDGASNSAWTHNNGIEGIKQMIRGARAEGLSVMLVYYVKAYSDAYNANATYNATQWWLGKLGTLGAEGEFALNLLNEPQGGPDATTWRNQQTNAVDQLRAAGFTGPIIIDAPGYGHETSFVSQQGRYVAANHTNVLFSVHVYPDSFYNGGLPGTTSAGSGGGDVGFMNALRSAANRPIILGEFGDTGGNFHDYRARVQEFMNNAQASSANCGAIGWAWNGDGTTINGVSYPMNANVDSNYLNWLKTVAGN